MFVVQLTLGVFVFFFCSDCLADQPIFLHRQHGHKRIKTGYQYQTSYFTQKVDHFGFSNDDTFQQRYLIADQWWNKDSGPIFFYTGNEGDIAWFCDNTGFMWDIASEFSALLVFAEHRYYGKSVPYGPGAYQNGSQLNYLTSEQALADFAVLIRHLKATIPGAKNSSVIAFGGSYGGMLSAWLRMKYPNVVVGALAASAPIWQFTGITPCEAFNEVLTKGFLRESSQCVDNIRNSWKTITDIGATRLPHPVLFWKELTLYKTAQFTGITPCEAFNEVLTKGFLTESSQCVDNIRNSWKTITDIGATADGRKLLTDQFKLCKPLMTTNDIIDFKSWLTNAWTDLAMVNYPYEASFLEPLPGWPVREVCKKLSVASSGQTLISDISSAVKIYFNYTGQAACLNISQQATADLGDLGWGYQSCTEMVMPICANGLTDMFEPTPWNFTQFSKGCKTQWKTMPRENWITTEYWGKNLQAASNIIFSLVKTVKHSGKLRLERTGSQLSTGGKIYKEPVILYLDMFEPTPWNFTQFSDSCKTQWKTTPRENWITTEYWGKNLQGASNIIFSNGQLDPWSSGGVLQTSSKTLVPIIIPDGAHHLDLRASNPNDPPSVINARKQEKEIMRQWLGMQDSSSAERKQPGPRKQMKHQMNKKMSSLSFRKMKKDSKKVTEMNLS